jgi:hypothetical protein
MNGGMIPHGMKKEKTGSADGVRIDAGRRVGQDFASA